MSMPIPVPNVYMTCSVCEKTTKFQLACLIDVNVCDGLEVTPSVYWFCTGCCETDYACDLDIEWSK